MGRRFLSTPSARRATPLRQTEPLLLRISIHALREEGDPRILPRSQTVKYFYPRPPRGGRPRADCRRPTRSIYFYPRPPRGGRRMRSPSFMVVNSISIHALREEGDTRAGSRDAPSMHFYPRPPRGGRRLQRARRWPLPHFYPRPPRGGRRPPWATGPPHGRFLSTPSARRATSAVS